MHTCSTQVEANLHASGHSSVEVTWEPRLGDGLEWDHTGHGQPKCFLHAQLLRRHTGGEPPREGVPQVGQDHMHHLELETDARAHRPAAGPERQLLEVLPFYFHGAADEPLRRNSMGASTPSGRGQGAESNGDKIGFRPPYLMKILKF